MSKTEFSTLDLPASMLKTLESLKYHSMTEIQKQSLPLILDKKDVIGQAKTGSGKTAAFGIGTVTSVDPESKNPSSLILCPTRELADQVANEIRKLARGLSNIKVINLVGGTPIMPQVRSLEHGCHIAVGTPGRVKDHIERNNVKLKDVGCFVLDEADRMLDMGFQDDINFIANRLPSKRQTLLFSATYPSEIASLSETYQRSPVMIKVESVHEENKIKQVFVEVKDQKKFDVLTKVLTKYQIESAMIFCRTKRQCDEIAEKLHKIGFFAEAIHGDLEQKDRNEVLTLFSNGSLHLLVATDVAARGIDIKALQAVVNFDISKDPAVHVHKIGRTGRADKEGLAITLFTDKETHMVEAIEDHLNIYVDKISENDLPGFKLPEEPKMATILIGAGKKAKLRPGDILGAVTKNSGIPGKKVGNINIFPWHSYVAVERSIVKQVISYLEKNRIKGKKLKCHLMD